MKKISLLIISAIFGFKAVAQDIFVKSIVDIKFQKGTEKLMSSTVQAMTKRGSKLNVNESKGEFYNIDNFILRLIPAQIKVPKGYLEDLKKETQDMFQLSPPQNYRSTIKSINNYKVLIIQYDRDSISYYTFYSVSNDNIKALNGIVEFKPSEKHEITNKLENLLKTMRFK